MDDCFKPDKECLSYFTINEVIKRLRQEKIDNRLEAVIGIYTSILLQVELDYNRRSSEIFSIDL